MPFTPTCERLRIAYNARLLQNNPRDTIERLVVNEKGKPEWSAVADGCDRLDRDKHEQIANWVAATCTPGLSLKETKEEITARTKFFKMVHNYQVLSCLSFVLAVHRSV